MCDPRQYPIGYPIGCNSRQYPIGFYIVCHHFGCPMGYLLVTGNWRTEIGGGIGSDIVFSINKEMQLMKYPVFKELGWRCSGSILVNNLSLDPPAGTSPRGGP